MELFDLVKSSNHALRLEKPTASLVQSSIQSLITVVIIIRKLILTLYIVLVYILYPRSNEFEMTSFFPNIDED